MTYLESLSSGEKVECCEDNQAAILKALNDISKQFQTTVYILLDESNNRAWISTNGSVFNYGDKVIEVIKDDDGEWNPPGYQGSLIDIQLAKLINDSQDCQ